MYEDILVEISPDVWSNEIDWELEGENGEIVAFGGDFPVFSQDSTFVDEFCLFGSCYTFKVYDSAGMVFVHLILMMMGFAMRTTTNSSV